MEKALRFRVLLCRGDQLNFWTHPSHSNRLYYDRNDYRQLLFHDGIQRLHSERRWRNIYWVSRGQLHPRFHPASDHYRLVLAYAKPSLMLMIFCLILTLELN